MTFLVGISESNPFYFFRVLRSTANFSYLSGGEKRKKSTRRFCSSVCPSFDSTVEGYGRSDSDEIELGN